MEEGELYDRDILCAECGETFNWSAEEQQFYLYNGLREPRRCSECRLKLIIASQMKVVRDA